MKETIINFQHSLIVSFRKKNHVPITWELGLVSLVLHASFIIHSMLPLEHTHWLDLLLLPQQLFLHQVYHMLEGFLHGQQYQECRIYLDKDFNLMCLLFCLLRKVLYLCRAGTTTWLVKDAECPVYPYISWLPWSLFFLFSVIWVVLFLCMNVWGKNGIQHCILPSYWNVTPYILVLNHCMKH